MNFTWLFNEEYIMFMRVLLLQCEGSNQRCCQPLCEAAAIAWQDGASQEEGHNGGADFLQVQL